jgi:hypothetical protein
MADRISKAFAVSGDKTAVPTDSTGTALSFEDGWSSAYELEVGVDAGARDIDRGQHNQLWNISTGNIKQWQEQAYPQFFTDIAYEAGATVRYTDDENYICHTSQAAGTLPTDHSAFINQKFFGSYSYAVSQLSGGNSSLVGFIYIGQTVDTFDYLIYPGDGRIYARGTVTGTIAGAFDPVTGTASGLSGALSLFQSTQNGVQKVTGSATFTNSTNNINLTGIGIGRENGDVVRIGGSTNNSKLFTIEVITDDDNVIVNQAHAGITWTAENKSLFSETTIVTCSLVCKWYVASESLGRGWVDISATRLLNTPYQISGNRPVKLNVSAEANADVNMSITVGGVVMSGSISRYNGSGLVRSTASTTIPVGVDYVVNVNPTNAQKFNWSIFA